MGVGCVRACVCARGRITGRHDCVEIMGFPSYSLNPFLFFHLSAFQVDVLEVQYAVLMKTLSRARDFESVRRAHDVFLASLTQDCFLLHKVRTRHMPRRYLRLLVQCCSLNSS